MPKARAKLKAALKKGLKKRLKARKRDNPRKAKKSDGRERGSLALLTAVIDKLGASVSKNSKSELTVTQFNHPPFVIDLKKLRIVEAEPETTNVAPAAPADAAE
jgi:hypothetical protein